MTMLTVVGIGRKSDGPELLVGQWLPQEVSYLVIHIGAQERIIVPDTAVRTTIRAGHEAVREQTRPT
jgi:hypothetical protein